MLSEIVFLTYQVLMWYESSHLTKFYSYGKTGNKLYSLATLKMKVLKDFILNIGCVCINIGVGVTNFVLMECPFPCPICWCDFSLKNYTEAGMKLLNKENMRVTPGLLSTWNDGESIVKHA